MFRTITRIAAVAGIALAAPVMAQAQMQVQKEAPSQDIVQTAVAAGQFTTLATALGEAGLVETLKGTGPFTVFAPTDAAFAKLPPGTVEALLKDKAKLRAVLLYHVVPGRLMAADVLKASSLKTVGGPAAKIMMHGGAAMIDGATIVKTDVGASNGVIHVIDAVLMPPATPAGHSGP
ncbi:MAG: fasciclin domain-containing protein [Gemmatirosa sp.]